MHLSHHTPDGVRRSRHQSLELYGLPASAAGGSAQASLAEIARLARVFTTADVAVVGLLPAGRHVTLAATAADLPDELPEEHSVCATLLEQRPVSTMGIADLAQDHRFADNPYVDGRLGAMRGYASAPLIGHERIALGTLCVAWTTPRTLSRDEASLLDQLARAVVKVLDDGRRDRRPATAFPERRVACRVAAAA